MKIIIVLISIFLSNLSFCQEKNLELILQEFYVEYSKVYRCGKDWVFIDKLYSNTELSENVYVLGVVNSLGDLLKEHSFDETLKYEYYLSDIYEYSSKEGLIKTKTFLLKDLSIIKEWKKAVFNLIEEKEIQKKVEFKCNSFDVNPTNFVFTTSLKSKVITIEDDGDCFFLSIFNNNCDIYERIKINKNEFSFLEEENYFDTILKSV